MIAKELMSMLKDVDPDTEILLSSDEEGNEFHYAAFVSKQTFEEKKNETLRVGPNETEIKHFKKHRKEEYEVSKSYFTLLENECLVLWPG